MQRYFYSKTGAVSVAQLSDELEASSIPIEGISWNAVGEEVRVDYTDGATPGEISTGASLVAAHVPSNLLDVVQEGDENVASIPGWASWSESTADAWYQTNVRDPFDAATTFATMKAVVGTIITVQWALIRMIIALRNKTWPNLQN